MIEEPNIPLNSKKIGRPLREFDKKIFEGLCHIHCTVDEIEKVFHTDQRTLDKWCQREYGESFSTIYKVYQSDGKASVRRYQFEHCKKNASMAMFLGKVLLGQVDTPQFQNSPNDGILRQLLSEIKEQSKTLHHLQLGEADELQRA